MRHASAVDHWASMTAEGLHSMRVLSFALFLAAVALASPAFAQKYRVVVLEIDGDQNNKLRNQIEAALVKADSVEIVSLDEFRAAAAKKKLNGAAAMTV